MQKEFEEMISTNNLKVEKLFFNLQWCKQLDHYILPPLVDDKPNTAIIHVSTNDILRNANHEGIQKQSKNFLNFTRKHLCWILFLIKLQAFKAANLLKRDSNTGVFP